MSGTKQTKVEIGVKHGPTLLGAETTLPKDRGGTEESIAEETITHIGMGVLPAQVLGDVPGGRAPLREQRGKQLHS